MWGSFSAQTQKYCCICSTFIICKYSMYYRDWHMYASFLLVRFLVYCICASVEVSVSISTDSEWLQGPVLHHLQEQQWGSLHWWRRQQPSGQVFHRWPRDPSTTDPSKRNPHNYHVGLYKHVVGPFESKLRCFGNCGFFGGDVQCNSV